MNTSANRQTRTRPALPRCWLAKRVESLCPMRPSRYPWLNSWAVIFDEHALHRDTSNLTANNIVRRLAHTGRHTESTSGQLRMNFRDHQELACVNPGGWIISSHRAPPCQPPDPLWPPVSGGGCLRCYCPPYAPCCAGPNPINADAKRSQAVPWRQHPAGGRRKARARRPAGRPRQSSPCHRAKPRRQWPRRRPRWPSSSSQRSRWFRWSPPRSRLRRSRRSRATRRQQRPQRHVAAGSDGQSARAGHGGRRGEIERPGADHRAARVGVGAGQHEQSACRSWSRASGVPQAVVPLIVALPRISVTFCRVPLAATSVPPEPTKSSRPGRCRCRPSGPTGRLAGSTIRRRLGRRRCRR